MRHSVTEMFEDAFTLPRDVAAFVMHTDNDSADYEAARNAVYRHMNGRCGQDAVISRLVLLDCVSAWLKRLNKANGKPLGAMLEKEWLKEVVTYAVAMTAKRNER